MTWQAWHAHEDQNGNVPETVLAFSDTLLTRNRQFSSDIGWHRTERSPTCAATHVLGNGHVSLPDNAHLMP